MKKFENLFLENCNAKICESEIAVLVSLYIVDSTLLLDNLRTNTRALRGVKRSS